MKTFKLALIGTAAIAALSVSARADSLDALKSQIDSLQLAAVADAPAAPATTVSWSGWARGGVLITHDASKSTDSDGYDTVDIVTRAGIYLAAKTETAVGEVGVNFGLISDAGQTETAGNGDGGSNGGNNYAHTDGFSGYWKMTPNLTMTVGILGSLSKSGYSFDANCTCWLISTGGSVGDNYTTDIATHDAAAIKLAYADGPLSIAAQVEDGNNDDGRSAVGVTGKIGYKMDSFGIDLNGGWWGNAEESLWGNQAAYAVSAGVGYSAGMFSFGGAIGTGEDRQGATITPVSVYGKVSLSDLTHFEAGWTKNLNTDSNPGEDSTAAIGFYYSPVKQITIGAEASTTFANDSDNGSYKADVVSKFSF